jgi:hypothetical protein
MKNSQKIKETLRESLREIIREAIKGRREIPVQDMRKKYNMPDINPSEFDWFGFLERVDTQMKGLNNEFVLTSLDKLKNEDKLTPIINKFIKIKDQSLNYIMKFNEFYSKLPDIDKQNYREVIDSINEYTTKKTKFEKNIFKMHQLLEDMKDIDNEYIF